MCNSFTLCDESDLRGALEALARELGDAVRLESSSLRSRTEGCSDEVVFPQMLAPVALIDHPDGSMVLEAQDLIFGVAVPWKSGRIFNARLGSLAEKGGMWGDALWTGRCIVPCASFFETHRTEMARSAKTGRKVKQRCSFTAPEGNVLYLAAVEMGDGFAVVTTDPNEDVAPVHDRMPLVLTLREACLWLEPSTPKEKLLALADRSHMTLTCTPLHRSDDGQLALDI